MRNPTFENISDQALINDYDELSELIQDAYNHRESDKKAIFDEYRDKVEHELNMRGWWINHRLGVFCFGDPND